MEWPILPDWEPQLIALQYHEVKIILQFSSGQTTNAFDVFGENKFQEVELNLYPDEEAVTLSEASAPLENQNTTQDDHDDEDE